MEFFFHRKLHELEIFRKKKKFTKLWKRGQILSQLKNVIFFHFKEIEFLFCILHGYEATTTITSNLTLNLVELFRRVAVVVVENILFEFYWAYGSRFVL